MYDVFIEHGDFPGLLASLMACFLVTKQSTTQGTVLRYRLDTSRRYAPNKQSLLTPAKVPVLTDRQAMEMFVKTLRVHIAYAYRAKQGHFDYF